VWRAEKSWNGVAILAHGCEPVLTRTALPGDAEDTQSRYIEAAVKGVLIATLYAPNGNPPPGPKFKCKLAWMIVIVLQEPRGSYTDVRMIGQRIRCSSAISSGLVMRESAVCQHSHCLV
jgi:exonuclease III